MEIDPKNENIYRNRGLAKFVLKDFIGSIADLSSALEIDPKIAENYYWRGIGKYKLGKKDDGCLDLSKAGELGYAKAYDMIQQYCQ